jgi:hypothetical protein
VNIWIGSIDFCVFAYVLDVLGTTAVNKSQRSTRDSFGLEICICRKSTESIGIGSTQGTPTDFAHWEIIFLRGESHATLPN